MPPKLSQNKKIRIKENKETLNKQLEDAVIKKIDYKINQLKTNKKFAELDKNLKAKVIDKTIVKVKIRILNIENKSDLTDLESQKLDLYKLLKSSLEKYKDSLLKEAAQLGKTSTWTIQTENKKETP